MNQSLTSSLFQSLKFFLMFILLVLDSPLVFSEESKDSYSSFVTQEKIQRIDDYLQQNIANWNVPGASIVIVESDRVKFTRSYGIKDISGEPVTTATSFKLGSVSKSFMAAVIMQLVTENKIQLDDPVSKYIPWLKFSNIDENNPVSVRHLLSHQSGLSTLVGNLNQGDTNTSDKALADAVKSYVGIELVSAPGTQFIYSNANFQILGHIAEIVEKQNYEKILDKRIFEPLKMNNAFTHASIPEGANLSLGFQNVFGENKVSVNPSGRVTIAQGGIYASIDDMAIYLKALINENHHVILNAHKAEMFTAQGDVKSPYGLGWFVREFKEGTRIFHFGQSPGFETLVALLPDQNAAFAILVNTNSAFGATNVGSLMAEVMPLMYGKDPYEVTVPIYEQVVIWGVFSITALVLFWAGNFLLKYMRDGNAQKFANKTIFNLWLPSLLLILLSYLIVFLLPSANAANLDAVKLFQPVAYWLIVTSGTTLTIWAIVRPLLLLRKR